MDRATQKNSILSQKREAQPMDDLLQLNISRVQILHCLQMAVKFGNNIEK